MYVTSFKKISQDLYHTVCRLDTNKFFAHLLFTDSISWQVLCRIKLIRQIPTGYSSKFYFKNLPNMCKYLNFNQSVKYITLKHTFEDLLSQ